MALPAAATPVAKDSAESHAVPLMSELGRHSGAGAAATTAGKAATATSVHHVAEWEECIGLWDGLDSSASREQAAFHEVLGEIASLLLGHRGLNGAAGGAAAQTGGSGGGSDDAGASGLSALRQRGSLNPALEAVLQLDLLRIWIGLPLGEADHGFLQSSPLFPALQSLMAPTIPVPVPLGASTTAWNAMARHTRRCLASRASSPSVWRRSSRGRAPSG